MYEVSLLSMEKSNNDEDKENSRKMTQGFNKILSVVNMVSGYIHVVSPIIKRNTIHRILEEILESNKKKLRAKNILLTKNFEKELPETIFDDKQIKFILSSILQYAILSAPPGGSIEIVTRFVNNQKGEDLIRVVPLRSKYSEIQIFSSYDEHPFHESAGTMEVPGIENDETSDFILHLVKEIIRRNQGMIEFQMDQTGFRTRISLKLPVERRQVAYYRPVNP
jgi:nitrogen-specific signal transduction histidine kinase